MTELMRDFAEGLRAELPPRERQRRAAAERSWLLDFVAEHVPTDHGRYTLAGHEPLAGIIELLERITVGRESESRVDVVKAEQVGLTTFAIGFALWLVAEYGYNVGYFLPDDKFASEFGMARLNPIVEQSVYLSSLMEDAAVDRGVLKQLGDKFLYLLGLSKLKGATSRPMDWQLSDEVDLTSEAVRKWKHGRMAASKMRAEFDFSAPYRQDSGIDARFKAGSQRTWRVRCAACGKDDICLEEIMDLTECFRQFSGTWVRVCPSCKRKLDVKAGRWVAAEPERERDRHYSFRLSAMAFEAIDANFIMKEYLAAIDDPEAMAIFDRTRRGIANAGALQPFTDVRLREMERDYVLKCTRTGNPIFVGGDVGQACWFWAEEWLPEGRSRLIYVEKIHSDQFAERSIELIRMLQPRFGVFDYMPLFTESRKIAYEFPRTIALLQFENGRAPEMIEEKVVIEGTVGAARRESGPSFLLIKGDRNRIVGEFCNESIHSTRGLLIPSEKTQRMNDVRVHLKKLQKTVEKDAKGNEIHKFLDSVDNHYGFAGAAARLARQFAPNVQPFTPVRLGIRTRGDELRNAIDPHAPSEGRRERMRRLI